jgi:hypothetical protein
MATSKDYQAKAAEALKQLASATSEAERTRLRRAHSAYTKLSTHDEEAAHRAATAMAPRIKPEKVTVASQSTNRLGAFTFK